MNRNTKKLIEVALPLEAINMACINEGSPFTPRHPRSLHVWWARRRLAVARAVILAQMLDDPSSVPEEFPTEEAQVQERQRLFRLIEEIVKWENTTNDALLEKARAEIRRSWARWCKVSGDDPHRLPSFYDPFAGGGALPLEAQRLGLEAYASDLNPVAVIICKAMIEIPPKFAGQRPINPEARGKGLVAGYKGAAGLADDVRYYGKWLRDEAQKRIGHLYPMATGLGGQNTTVIAWLWARTVESPNPAFRGCHVPLVSSFWLSTKKGKETWAEPIVEGKEYRFEIRTGKPTNTKAIDGGTKLGRGANFRCVLSGSPVSPDYIRAEAQAGRMQARLMAIVAEGDRGRLYLPPTNEHETIARQAQPAWKPDQKVTTPCHDVDRLPMYGMYTWGDAFTPRQLVTLTTFSDLVAEARDKVRVDANSAGLTDDATPLRDGGTGATAYAEAVSVYFGLAISRWTDLFSSLSSWNSTNENIKNLFSRQVIPMVWDFAESNPFGSGASFSSTIETIFKLFVSLPTTPAGQSLQIDARLQSISAHKMVSTDPPYYDNISYADLSDFFYVWLRRSLKSVYPDLFATLAVPKAEELVATRYRHGSREKAEAFFLDGMTQAMHRLAEQTHPAFPVTIYYAFKQSEGNSADGTASTGWETFLDAVIRAGFTLTGTWPVRTERTEALKKKTNVLASSIVLVCRPRPVDASVTTRRDFLTTLKREIPPAVRALQQGNIAPVDLAQASIGPGMAIYSRYARILEADGSAMKVRTALAIINQTLDELLAEQEGDFDADTGWAVAWFDQFAFNDGPFGEAEVLCTAKNTSVDGLKHAGIVVSGTGKVRLLRIDELPTDWDPTADNRLTIWETTHHLIRALKDSESSAAALLTRIGGVAEPARELAYRLYNVCERRKRSVEAQNYNALVQSWPEIARLATEGGKPSTVSGRLL
jgi:putative DNA methylase